MTKKKVPRGRPKLNPSERKGVLLQIRMPPGLVESLKTATKAEDMTVSGLVRRLLEEWLAGRSTR